MGEYIPIFIMMALAGVFALAILLLSWNFGRRRPTAEKLLPYECGIIPETSARGRFSVKFFLVAMSFIVFDVEAIFLVPWAVVARELKLYGFLAILVFLLMVALSLAYEWRRGALEWD